MAGETEAVAPVAPAAGNRSGGSGERPAGVALEAAEVEASDGLGSVSDMGHSSHGAVALTFGDGIRYGLMPCV
ncbi:MAG: hypothetical protein WCJ04_07915 [Actinomycetes bacterium]